MEEKEARVIFFSSEKPDTATDITFGGLMAKFMQDISDNIVNETETYNADELLAGIYLTTLKNADNEKKRIQGVVTTENASEIVFLIAHLIAEFSMQQAKVGEKNCCEFICNMALQIVQERLAKKRKSKSCIMLSDVMKIIKKKK